MYEDVWKVGFPDLFTESSGTNSLNTVRKCGMKDLPTLTINNRLLKCVPSERDN